MRHLRPYRNRDVWIEYPCQLYTLRRHWWGKREERCCEGAIVNRGGRPSYEIHRCGVHIEAEFERAFRRAIAKVHRDIDVAIAEEKASEDLLNRAGA